jgi:hypothetical protein
VDDSEELESGKQGPLDNSIEQVERNSGLTNATQERSQTPGEGE